MLLRHSAPGVPMMGPGDKRRDDIGNVA